MAVVVEIKKPITLVSSDGFEVNISLEAVKTLKTLWSNIQTKENYESMEFRFSIPIATKEDIQLLAEFLDYHDRFSFTLFPKPLQSLQEHDNMTWWDVEFLKLGEGREQEYLDQLLRMTNLADFLNCADLLSICCIKVLCLLPNKSKEDLANLFRVENQTVEKVALLRKDNSWIFKD